MDAVPQIIIDLHKLANKLENLPATYKSLGTKCRDIADHLSAINKYKSFERFLYDAVRNLPKDN